jgi:FtsH-binding integral membrane protein
MARQLEGNEAMSARMSIVGSLVLYLDFINLFLFILRILGRRSS